MIYGRSLVDALRKNKGSEKGIRFIYSAVNEEFMSYGELYKKALGILRALQDRGIKPGEEMVFQIEDNKTFILMFWACLMGGIIPVPVTAGNNDEYRLKVLKVWKILKKPRLAAGRKALDALLAFSAENGFAETSEEIKNNTVFPDEIEVTGEIGRIIDAGPDDTAFIQFSSGSTGDPKGVVLTHGNLLANIDGISKATKMTRDDSYLCWMPVTHDLALIGSHLNPLANDLNQYFMPTSLFIRRPMLWLQKACEHKATKLSSPNFGYKYLLDSFKPENARGLDLSAVRILFNGAEPISAEICDEFMDVMAKYGLKRTAMYPVYGLAEASVAVAFPPPGEDIIKLKLDRRFLSAGDTVKKTEPGGDGNSITFVNEGYPLHNCSVRICNGDNGNLNDDTVGYIQIKGDNVTQGYYNDEEATKKVMTADGWLNTGDLGFMRSGRLIVTGRAKDIIFVNGQNFYPHDIERAAEGVEGIGMGDTAACGIFNKARQREELVIFVHFKKEIEEFIPLARSLKSWINRQTGVEADDLVPVKKIPKTTSGKIQRYKLAQMYEEGVFSEISAKIRELILQRPGGGTVNGPHDEFERELHDIFTQVLNAGPIGVDDNFFELGATSLQLTQAADKIDGKYPGKISVADMFKYTTIARLAKFLQGGRNITLPAVALPHEYFRQARGAPEIICYNLRVENSVRLKLAEISAGEGAVLNGLLLSV
jgi:acyl-CoA synthetase (AMP-forming)/AMP-acid ligase II/acyl carrier protein